MRIGVDVGGTFTDFVLLEDATGRARTYKCLTTPRDPSEAIEQGLRALAAQAPGCIEQLQEVIHGTTLVINAIIERKGARTGLITTRGFRDVLELAREIRYAAYDAFAQMPEPLVPRERRLEVDERLRADGSVLVPLDEAQARRTIREMSRLGVESVAVCLLNSFENPAHELALKRLLAEELPQASLSISYEVLPQIREYERTSTTVTNAYVKPLTETYLRRMRERLAGLGFRGRLFIMLSSGGVTSAETAAEFPVRIIESGPTAAVIAAQYYSRLFRCPEMFCFDMGGTTAKSCLIQGGAAAVVPSFEVGRVQRFQKGSGLTIQVPVVDLMEIGAGGGSIARASRLGTLQVGPHSAGAEPGPICYGRGGNRAHGNRCRSAARLPRRRLLSRRHDAARCRGRATRHRRAGRQAARHLRDRSGLGHPRPDQRDHGRCRENASRRTRRQPATRHGGRIRRGRPGARLRARS